MLLIYSIGLFFYQAETLIEFGVFLAAQLFPAFFPNYIRTRL